MTMKAFVCALAASGALLAAAPAYAGGVGVRVGPVGVGIGEHHHWRDDRGPYAYERDCRVMRDRTVTPSGRVIIRTRRVCR